MPIPFRLDQVIEQTLNENGGREQRALRRLAGVRLSQKAALVVWPRLLEHKWYLSERLGRDVGLRVAAVDYFENIRPLSNTSLRLSILDQLRRMSRPVASVRVA